MRNRWFGGITVRPVHGYEYKPIEGMHCRYANLRDFLVQWKPTKVLDPHWHEKLSHNREASEGTDDTSHAPSNTII
jgi:hypothetical protein